MVSGAKSSNANDYEFISIKSGGVWFTFRGILHALYFNWSAPKGFRLRKAYVQTYTLSTR